MDNLFLALTLFLVSSPAIEHFKDPQKSSTVHAAEMTTKDMVRATDSCLEKNNLNKEMNIEFQSEISIETNSIKILSYTLLNNGQELKSTEYLKCKDEGLNAGTKWFDGRSFPREPLYGSIFVRGYLTPIKMFNMQNKSLSINKNFQYL